MMREVILTDFCQKQPLKALAQRPRRITKDVENVALRPLCPLCEVLFQLSSPDEEDHFHYRCSGCDRAVFASGSRWLDDILRRPGPPGPKDRADRLGGCRRTNPPRAR